MHKLAARMNGRCAIYVQVFDAALTREDEMICEARVAWGSALTVRVAATLRIPGGGGELYIPVTVRNVAVNASVRVRAFPALPEPPFFGQIAISLLAPPHVQFELPVGQRADIMSLPGEFDTVASGLDVRSAAERLFEGLPAVVQVGGFRRSELTISRNIALIMTFILTKNND